MEKLINKFLDTRYKTKLNLERSKYDITLYHKDTVVYRKINFYKIKVEQINFEEVTMLCNYFMDKPLVMREFIIKWSNKKIKYYKNISMSRRLISLA
jgi:hypothetical protein